MLRLNPLHSQLPMAMERRTPQTVVEIELYRRTSRRPVRSGTVKSGDYVMIRPEHVMAHDNHVPGITKPNSIGATRIHNPAQAVFTLDHDVQNKSEKNLEKYASIERLDMVGSHDNMYGGVGCVETLIVRTNAAALWATGKTWWQVPRMVKVELKGRIAPGMSGKNVVVALCGSLNKNEVPDAALEFMEWLRWVGVFPVDETLPSLYDRPSERAEYSSHLVSGPNSVKVSTPLPGNEVASGVEFYIAAASPGVLPVGCGPCIGLSVGLLEEHETGTSATNRNHKDYMGHPKAQACLSSLAVICGPASLDRAALPPVKAPTFSIVNTPASSSAASSTEADEPLLPRFPTTIAGPLLFAPKDNLNTDGIYPRKHTYRDDIRLAGHADVVMEKYDPAFAALVAKKRQAFTPFEGEVKEGAVLVARLRSRNAINNGLVDLTERYAKDDNPAGGKNGESTVDMGMKDGKAVFWWAGGLHSEESRTGSSGERVINVGYWILDLKSTIFLCTI
ncbi:hypothetical protein FPV67DRAFT_1606656 [Lyophyllum atratum]|nr:hypothetical protein FPV67DRAFT_1606656 [Lyophyllum atratum]